jgi:hypothetical protein
MMVRMTHVIDLDGIGPHRQPAGNKRDEGHRSHQPNGAD